MNNVYLIKPLQKKSIVWHAEMYRQNEDGSVSWFNISETYRWGQGFIQADMDCNLPFEGDLFAYAKNDCGWGSELEDSCAVDWEFSDDLTEEEKQFIENCYYDGNPNDKFSPGIGGAAWLFDGDHDWKVEDDYLEILGPFQVSLCNEDGTVIEENVKLKPAPVNSKASWPF